MDNPTQKMRLSPSHLQAIGEVASEWSLLEFAFQCAMVDASHVPYNKVLAFTAPSPMYGWIEILSNLLRMQNPDKKLPKELTSMFDQIRKIQRKRNNIVHAVWSIQFPNDIGKNKLCASDKAYGIGFLKNSKNPIIQHSYTATEMRAVAMEIRQLAEKFRSFFWPDTSLKKLP